MHNEGALMKPAVAFLSMIVCVLLQASYSYSEDINKPSSLICTGTRRGRVANYELSVTFKNTDLGYLAKGKLRKVSKSGRLLASYRLNGTWTFLAEVLGVASGTRVNGEIEYKQLITVSGGFIRGEGRAGDGWIIGFYKHRPDKAWLTIDCRLRKVVYPKPDPMVTATPVVGTPIPAADIYVFLITNAADTLFVGSEPEIYGKALCLIEGAGTDCNTKVIYTKLVGPFDTDELALRQGVCANITALHYNKLVPWGPWARWGTGDTWYRLFEPSAEAALKYCPNLPLQ